MPITFPTTRMLIKIELALGADRTQLPASWVWTDITAYWRPNSLIQKTVGRPDETSLVDPGVCTFQLDNSDGRFVRTNPNGAYYGQLQRGTPVRIQWDAGTGVYTQFFFGEVPSWAPRWDMSLADRYVNITASGSFRRLNQSKAPLRSPMYRYGYMFFDDDGTYYSMEDSEGSTAAQPDKGPAGAISLRPLGYSQFFTEAGTRLPAPGAPAFGQSQGEPPGSAKIIDLTKGGTLFGSIPQVASDPGEFGVDWTMRFNVRPSGYTTFDQPIFRWQCVSSGTFDLWSVFVDNDQIKVLAEYTVSGGGGLFFPLTVDLWDGSPHHFRVTAHNDTGQIRVRIYIDDNQTSFGLVAGNVSQISSVFINPLELSGDLMPTAFGHLGLKPSNSRTAGAYGSVGATFAYTGEETNVRIQRICFQDDIEYLIFGGDTQTLGPQKLGLSLMELMREAEAADNGLLFEYQTGIRYENGEGRYTAPVSLALAFSDLSAPPEPVDDDQSLRNSVIVKRPDGAEQRWSDEASIIESGLIDRSLNLSLETDAQALARAQWEVYKGTYPGLRWPSVSLNLASRPAHIPAWGTVNVGSKMTISGPPDEIGTETITMFIEGWTESIGWYDWFVDMNCSNGEMWVVAELEDAVLGKADTEGSAINTLANTTATSLSVKTNVGPVWTTSGAEFPFDIVAGTGEKMTVTNITGGSSPQTFTVVRSINGVVKTLPVDTDIRLANPMVLAY